MTARKTRPARRHDATELDTKVFVYGTLLSGCSNHRFLKDAHLLRAAHTTPMFVLYDLGQFPGLVAGGSQSIVGEVYRVEEATLAALDRLESHPTFYRREEIVLHDGTTALAYLLTLDKVRGCSVIASGSWRDHVSRTRTP